MDAIISFFETIFSYIEMAFNFVKGLINNLFMMIKYVGLAFTTITNLILSLPTWLQATATATIFFTILYLILGRSTGGQDD